MEFDDQAGYDAYNVHPLHIAFVRDRWVPEVADFLEIDYAKLYHPEACRCHASGPSFHIVIANHYTRSRDML